MIKPARLQKGATIGVISPASPSGAPSEILRLTEWFEQAGYRVVLGKNLNKTKGFTAGSELDRAEDFMAMFRDDAVDAVFVTQGGYGAAQLYRHIDFDVVRQNPKIFTGFSDITSLHLAIGKEAGVVSFHAPGAARFNSETLTDYTRDAFFRALASTEPLGEIRPASPKVWLNPIAPGVAEGVLAGGNLTLVCASLGTPYEIDTRGKILFIEDVDSEPWVVDHNLSHLRNAGKLDDVAGIVVGECENCRPLRFDPGYLVDTSLEEVLIYYLAGLGVPVLYGLPLGHTEDMATLPLGVPARLDADNKVLTVLESGVR